MLVAILSVRIASVVVSTPLKTTPTGIAAVVESAATISRECVATSAKVFAPYRFWLPVTNQTSYCFKLIIEISLKTWMNTCQTMLSDLLAVLSQVSSQSGKANSGMIQ